MIQLTHLPRYKVAHVVGSGPSAGGLDPKEIPPGSLVVACSGAAHRFSSLGLDLIHLTADYPTAKTGLVARGALGVWVRLGDSAPFPPRSGFPCWVPCSTGEDHWAHRWGWKQPGHLSVMVGGGAGCAAWNLVDEISDEVHLWGLDGGGAYERMRPGLEYAAATCLSPFVDHAGRLSK